MKKTNIFKIAMTLVMAFMITGAFAQPFEDANYSEDNATDMYQTVGKSFGLYVIPDANYSPLYAGAGTIGAGVQWTWTFAGLGASGAIVSGIAQGSNYVEFSNPASTGPYSVVVAESNTAGACAGGNITQVVNIIETPAGAALTATHTDADWLELVADLEYQRCTEMLAGEDITVTFDEVGVPAAMANYAYGVEMVQTAYDTDGTTVINTSVAATVINYDTDGKVAGGAIDGGSVTELCGVALEYYDNAGTDCRTKYEFTLIEASNGPGAAFEGIISQISHKSDYIDAAVTTYAFLGNTVTYWINLPPVTGPIYHIPNNYTF